MKSPGPPNIAHAPLCATIFAVLCAASYAGPLQQAEINKIINDVRIVKPQESAARPARVRDVVKDDVAVRTGVQSRAELLFQDKTLTRIGPDSLFSFTAGTRNMALDRGTMLLQVPKGLGGAQIRTAAVTAAITGTTILLENMPGQHVKVAVLEGKMRLSMNKRFGGSVTLTPGTMVILGANDKRMPKPVAIDLAKLVKTSALVDPKKFGGKSLSKAEPLPSIGLIESEIAVQSAAKAASRLVETDLIIKGKGNKAVSASGETSIKPGLRLGADAAPGRDLHQGKDDRSFKNASLRNEFARSAVMNDGNGTSGGTSGGNSGGLASGVGKAKRIKTDNPNKGAGNNSGLRSGTTGPGNSTGGNTGPGKSGR